jgi:hypothetical protein
MKTFLPIRLCSAGALLSLALCACGSSESTSAAQAQSPDDAAEVTIDRFAPGVGMLQQRSPQNALPDPGEAVDFDRPPFITQGLGPSGQAVAYYNFDVQPTAPAPIYALFRAGQDTPVPGQLNIVDAVPGATGYSDFWQVQRVQVPADYVANSVTSLAAIQAAGYPIEATDELVNCPIVPSGSTAQQRLGGADPGLSRGWYRGQVVYYFNFTEHALTGQSVPLADIFVTFNVNPGLDGGGPPSGFKLEPNGEQTHNVISALPDAVGYSPLWAVSPYDNADFYRVKDLATVAQADVLARDVANVNCPVVEIEGAQ